MSLKYSRTILTRTPGQRYSRITNEYYGPGTHLHGLHHTVLSRLMRLWPAMRTIEAMREIRETRNTVNFLATSPINTLRDLFGEGGIFSSDLLTFRRLVRVSLPHMHLPIAYKPQQARRSSLRALPSLSPPLPSLPSRHGAPPPRYTAAGDYRRVIWEVLSTPSNPYWPLSIIPNSEYPVGVLSVLRFD